SDGRAGRGACRVCAAAAPGGDRRYCRAHRTAAARRLIHAAGDGMILLSPDDLDFSAARPVVSSAQKFVIPVAPFADAVPLRYPAGAEKAGQPITDWGGQPVGDKGIIFFNEIDRCYQAAPADGRSVIIINEVAAGQVQALQEFIARLEEPIEHLCK